MSHESLSALLDGECSAEETARLLEQIESSPALKVQWSRMCLTREALAGTRVRKAQACICAGVMANLDPVPEAVVNPRVVELTRRRPLHRWQSLAGLAAAASLAAVALLVSFNTSTPVGSESAATANVAMVSPQGASAAHPAVTQTRDVAYQQGDGSQQWTDAGDDLDNYLMEHNSSVAGQEMSVGGTLRYARFAAHSAAYQPGSNP
ncbi:MAG TPA: sigma-E factor negative regulatory protein [Stenotrophobium sp.]|jgi:negative regulator of sigma E activity|nr:sigma-E factor negative regulatory protein [Stenotrophobium sp.]